MAYTDTYFMGATQVIVPVGITGIEILPGPSTNGGFFKISSGAGTLSIIPRLGISSNVGYPVGAAEVISWSGPARFFLSAGGATTTICMVPSYTAGYSLYPGG